MTAETPKASCKSCDMRPKCSITNGPDDYCGQYEPNPIVAENALLRHQVVVALDFRRRIAEALDTPVDSSDDWIVECAESLEAAESADSDRLMVRDEKIARLTEQRDRAKNGLKRVAHHVHHQEHYRSDGICQRSTNELHCEISPCPEVRAALADEPPKGGE